MSERQTQWTDLIIAQNAIRAKRSFIDSGYRKALLFPTKCARGQQGSYHQHAQQHRHGG